MVAAVHARIYFFISFFLSLSPLQLALLHLAFQVLRLFQQVSFPVEQYCNICILHRVLESRVLVQSFFRRGNGSARICHLFAGELHVYNGIELRRLSIWVLF
jgi:hypothetical protein